jgi:DNA-binding CsgD family transcriptional regulator
VLASSLTQRENIAQLYRTGLSAREIAEKTNTGIDAVYYTLRLLKVARRSHSENSKTRFARKPLSYHIKTSLSQSEELLKTASIMLYWAEGYKVGDMTTIDFANSDPAMALIFTKFLREICRVDETRIRAKLYCYDGQNVRLLTKFWSEYLSIPASQFTKPYVKAAANQGTRGPRMLHGLVHVRYCDKKLHRQILDWITEYQQLCVGGGVVNRRGL